jgi:2-C-methyl-D-erythritol 2,4-cyclodiphosphate synthase
VADVTTGIGFDAHRFGGPGPLRLAGVVVDVGRGLDATSDGDVAVHAVMDAMLGAAALGDIGTHFPSDDPRWRGADSMQLLALVHAMVADTGLRLLHVDLTIVSESVRVAPHREAMRTALAHALGLGVGAVSVKASTTDGMGWTGRDEGVAALAVATLDQV